MKIKGKMILLVSVVAILLLALNATVFSQDEDRMKMDEYKAKLAEMEQREVASGEEAAALETEIAALKADIDSLQAQIDAEWEAIYALLGTDKTSVDAYRDNLNAIGDEIDGLDSLSPEELFQQRDEIKAVEAKIEEAKAGDLAVLSEMEDKIAELEAKVSDLKAKLPANIYDQYTVIGGDYLWKISSKEDIYNDPYQWIRIYCVNKDQIKDPDLIHPDQILNIARGVGENEYLVAKGDFLSKIAGSADVFNDPTKWTKIYEVNKDIISEPSLIYPHQVLTIPAE